jgi:Uma2 family endonuclease
MAGAEAEAELDVLPSPPHARAENTSELGMALARMSRIGRATLPDRRCYHQRVTSAPRHRYTYSEYVALERDANVRHEYFDGEIYAMAGGTPEHAGVCANVATALNVQLRGRGCRVYSSDLSVRVIQTGLTTYPDVTVVCSKAELDPESRNTVTNPKVVVEVLSPSTAAYDRGEKLSHYKRIPSLQEIVLVAHDEHLLEVWRREDDGTWTRSQARAGALALSSISCSLDVEDVYRDELAAT